MAKLFDHQPVPLQNYKDTSVSHYSLAQAIFNDSYILAIPKEIYQHLSKYSGCIFKTIHKYLSYDDIAKLIRINNQLGFCDSYKDKIFSNLPESVQLNVNYLLETKTLQASTDSYLNDPGKDYLSYDIIITGNTIVVILEDSFLYNYKEKTQKVEFLKKLYETSYNIMGECTATAKPFFLELVDAL